MAPPAFLTPRSIWLGWLPTGTCAARYKLTMIFAACVVDSGHRLVGLITDGDVRRALQAHDDIRGLRASGVMTVNPATIDPAARLQDALRLMEDRPSQISVLPVVDPATGTCLGLLRLHDIYRADLER